MTLESFFGCAFVAFGPALSMFAITVFNDAQQVLVLISSAFFWLLSLLVSAMWWQLFNFTILKNYLVFSMIFSVIFQEIFRLFLWMVLRRAEEGLIVMNGSYTPLRKIRFHYVSGLGYGLMSGLFAMVNILADITGPGTVGLFGDNNHFVIVSAFLTNCFVLLHTCWGILFFDAMDAKKWKTVLFVCTSHLAISLLTLLNKHYTYWPSLITGYILLVVMGIWSFRVVGGSSNNLTQLFKKKDSS
ncbi:gamma-secretase subunit Aph-1 [Hydra vulgaris]|uniref:gamma-secretase subunit Aph-1 n=1 Tax=Hydra vulgaris TaxID=6087 RepID=UPI001F5EFDB9|nr:gamma-secretase subunit Aph-1 [Hydra vulgaris]